MKRTVLFVLLVSLFCVSPAAGYASRQSQLPAIGGRVVDENGRNVEYATVVLLTDEGAQVAGATSDSSGQFQMNAPKGEYQLKVLFLGYDDYVAEVSVTKNSDMGDIVLTPSSVQMEAVTVTARNITREADRFVVTVANNPVAVGKDGYEMLKASPSVWVSGDGVSINGRSGTRIMINERLLRLEPDAMEAYLRSIPAEDIEKIEIIPYAGANYDADSSAGVVKITLKKKRNDGIEGSVRLGGSAGYYGNVRLYPSFNLNYHSGKLGLYANGSYGYHDARAMSNETTRYLDNSEIPGAEIKSASTIESRDNTYHGTLGFVYDFNPKNSIGAEFGINRTDTRDTTYGTSNLLYNDGPPMASIRNRSNYSGSQSRTYISGTFNYIRKLDDKGSVMKIIGDYNQNIASNPQSYNDISTAYSGETAGAVKDSLYRSLSEANYRIASLNANFDFVLNPTTVIKAGGKFTHNNMYSLSRYSSFDNNQWGSVYGMGSKTDYIENVAALYAIGNMRFGRVGIAAGLRGEYTFITPRFEVAESEDETSHGGKKKCYFDLFPDINVSLGLNQAYSNMLVFSYSRKISRPGFWALNPIRMMLSKYSAIVGNPDLKPTYSNDISLTGILKYKYSLTFGARFTTNTVMQMTVQDPENPEGLLYRQENLPIMNQLYLALNAPVDITKWLTLRFNIVGYTLQQQLYTDTSVNKMKAGLQSYIMMNITLPKEFSIEVSHFAMTNARLSNMEQKAMHNLNASVKKKFGKGKFIAGLSVDNILDQPQRVNSFGDVFYKEAIVNNGNYLTVGLSLSYNFQAGVSFRSKKVEKGSAEDAQRLGGGGSSGATVGGM